MSYGPNGGNEMYSQFLNSSGDLVFLKDDNFRYLISNDANSAFLGKKGEEIIGKTDFDLMPRQMAERCRESDEAALKSDRIIVGSETVGESVFETRKFRVSLGDGRFGVGSYIRDVTPRMRAEEKLRMLEFALDNSADTVFQFASDARLLYVNKAGCERLGYSLEELLSMKIHDLDPDYSVERWPEHWRQFRERKNLFFETFHYTKSGKRVPVEVSANHLMFGDKEFVISFIRDISERRHIETALRESEAQLASAMKIARLGHWELDVESGMFTFSDSFYFIFRTNAGEMGGYRMSIADYAKRFVHPEDAAMVEEETRKAIEATDAKFNHYLEHRMLYADGSVGHIAVHYFVVKDANGKTIKTYGVNQDISEHKKAEQAQKMAQLGKLAADMAHEVNNPLMIISGNAQIALMESNDGKITEMLETIISESKRIKEIMQRVLKFSRPGHGRMEKAAINSVIGSAVKLLEHQYNLINVRFDCRYDGSVPPVNIDENQLIEVLVNLFTNAKEAMESGGVITVTTGAEGAMVRVDVRDSGCGMDAEVMERIFEPFFTTKEKGTGLGLAVCQGIMCAHNGRLMVSSQPGKGSVFTMLLPAAV